MQWAIVTLRERSDIISLNFYLSQTPPTPVIQLSHISNFCMWFITFLLVFILSEIIPPSLSMSVMIFDRSLSTDHSCRRYWCYYCCCCCVTTTKDTLPITQVSFTFLSSGNQCCWSFYICPPTVMNRLDFICMSPSPPLPSPLSRSDMLIFEQLIFVQPPVEHPEIEILAIRASWILYQGPVGRW